MIGGVNGGSPLQTLLQARNSATSRLGGFAAKIADLVPKDEKREKAQQAADTLKQAVTNGSRERKAAAQQKIDRLKQELLNLKMMGGDPKAIARQAARIAQELGAAAKEYSAAGGGGGGGADAAAPQEATPDAAAAKPQEATPDAAAAKPEASALTGPAETTVPVKADATTLPTAEAKTPEQQRQAFADKVNQDVAKLQQKGDAAQADAKVVAEIRRLAAELKALIEQQRRRAAAENRDDAEFDQISKQMTQAGQVIDQALGDGGVDAAALMMPTAIPDTAPVNIWV